jgi:hypothetical protein
MADTFLLPAESRSLGHLRVQKFVDYRYKPARPRRDLHMLGTGRNRELRVRQEAEPYGVPGLIIKPQKME